MSTETNVVSIVDRDAELAEARAVIDLLKRALSLLVAADDDATTIRGARERAEAFLERTDYVGSIHAHDPPVDRQVVAHAVKTLRARAGAVEDGVIWHDPSMIERLQLPSAGPVEVATLGPDNKVTFHMRDEGVIPLAPVDQRWFATMGPDVGLALADLLDGKGTAAALARAVLYRPEDPDGSDDE